MANSIINALLGGTLVGFAGLVLLYGNGRIMGISGIIRGSFIGRLELWRLAFILGANLGALALYPLGFTILSESIDRPLWLVGIGGFLVGLGTTIGSGCTSGHGVCGISRFSLRSVVATITFISSGMVAILVLKILGWGL